ncbi:MAG TPA: hypothetical protein VFB76_09635 [Candidatus Angelobacter sp.]|nr:hypothetical protein [Candidatus Angelobacter sp.]
MTGSSSAREVLSKSVKANTTARMLLVILLAVMVEKNGAVKLEEVQKVA